MGSSALADEILSGRIETSDIGFWNIRWLDRRFLVLDPNWLIQRGEILPGPYFRFNGAGFAYYSSPIFGIDYKTAVSVLSAFSAGLEEEGFIDIGGLETELRAEARSLGGALFPDGFAVFGDQAKVESDEAVVWNTANRDFGNGVRLA
jgi:hypothetical protein